MLESTNPTPAAQPEMQKRAFISDCGLYRYRLTRTWDKSLPEIVWIMLNPLGTDAEDDSSPTIKKCINISMRLGAGGIVCLNLFAYRATRLKQLIAAEDPVGPENDDFLWQETDGVGGPRRIIAAWGKNGKLLGRDKQVLALLRNRTVQCLKTTKDGHPWHPLYVPADTIPMIFNAGTGEPEGVGHENHD